MNTHGPLYRLRRSLQAGYVWKSFTTGSYAASLRDEYPRRPCSTKNSELHQDAHRDYAVGWFDEDNALPSSSLLSFARLVDDTARDTAEVTYCG